MVRAFAWQSHTLSMLLNTYEYCLYRSAIEESFPNAYSTWDRPKSIAGWTAVASKLSETAPAKWDIPINWLTNVEVWLAGKAEGDMAQGVDNG